MATNVEIKASIPDLEPIRAKVARLTPVPSQIINQTDTFFVVPRGRLKIREFSNGSGELISYDRADRARPRESVYTRVACQNVRPLLQALSSALQVRGIVAKQRELFLVGRTRVHLDQVESLGSFVEVEVVMEPGEPVEHGHREAHDLLRGLDIPERALVAQAYSIY